MEPRLTAVVIQKVRKGVSYQCEESPGLAKDMCRETAVFEILMVGDDYNAWNPKERQVCIGLCRSHTKALYQDIHDNLFKKDA